MRIHFIAIGGAIMHSLAIELFKNGHHVTGSDDIIYDPARSNLNEYGLLPKHEGWNDSLITDNLDLVIIGMHAKLNNPELLKAQRINIKILSFPEFISQYSKNKTRIVISGSHGKTTITSMILHVLNINNIEADYLLGAKIKSFSNLVCLKNNNLIIIEGDEYLSSPLDRRPKFTHYNPHVLVISGVAWDHINVFPTVQAYEDAFKSLINSVTKSKGDIYYHKNDSFLSNYLKHNEYSKSYCQLEYILKDDKFCIKFNDEIIPLKIFGNHNLQNLEAAKLVCLNLGISEKVFYHSIKSFEGADNRLNLIKKYINNSCVYRDFAHSPSKVLATVNAVKTLYPNRYLISCYELHTFSSLNSDFLSYYENAFSNSDEVWIYIDPIKQKLKGITSINSSLIFSSLKHNRITFINNKEKLKSLLLEFTPCNNNLLLMSSGTFSGLDLITALSN